MALVRVLLLLLLAAVVVQAMYAFGRARPQNVPWTPVRLGDPVGLFTGRKLTALRDDPDQCRALVQGGAARVTPLPPRRDGAQCGYDDAVRLDGPVRFSPNGLGVSCPVAAALLVWEREVVQPAAARLLGSRVTRIDHFGSYSCRRIYGRDAGSWSEHSTASAIDVAGFALADGRRVRVVADWTGGTGEEAQSRAAFLREVRDGACQLFSTTLSPDYNAAHRDHLHLDQAARGAMGWRGCR